jgi:uncharacterized Zn-binding protein involved in type VI secretion
MPFAARITDMHTCPAHGGGPVVGGDASVLIGYMPAARVGDTMICPPAVDVIQVGEPSVIIGHKDAARVGDATAHGGMLAMGCPSVIIGSSPQAQVLRTDKPFCEECEKARQAREKKQREEAPRS